MVREYLQLIFKNDDGKNFTISVYDPKGDLTEEQVASVMEDIIEKNIFYSPGGELKSKVGARIITREVDSLIEF